LNGVTPQSGNDEERFAGLVIAHDEEDVRLLLLLREAAGELVISVTPDAGRKVMSLLRIIPLGLLGAQLLTQGPKRAPRFGLPNVS
jgi:hypothetical protein